jgi:hypothetical protein
MRVYLPVAVDVLAQWRSSGSLAPPVSGFGVVAGAAPAEASESSTEEADQEAAEYAAFSAAVAAGTDFPRLVVSVDCEDSEVVTLAEADGAVQVAHPIAWAAVAAVHSDDPDAAGPDPLGHLLWFAAAEVEDLLARLGTDPGNQ